MAERGIILENHKAGMGQRILFADDDPIVRRIYQHHIERAGYEWLEVDNGRDALEAASREKFVLAVLDILMPERDGLSVLLEFKKSPRTSAMPVIMITACQAYYSYRQEVKAAGAACLLTKPFGPAQLLAAIAGCLA
jgi:CheY-like chemotaxis protein